MLKNQDKLLLIFALLVGDAARSLASRLARGLALAATAVFNSLGNILGFDGFDSAHDEASEFVLTFNNESLITQLLYHIEKQLSIVGRKSFRKTQKKQKNQSKMLDKREKMW